MIINNKICFEKPVYISDYTAYEQFDFDNFKNTNKKFYNTEVLLVTNCNNLINVLLFLYWHLYIIKFDHIVVFDNSDDSLLAPYIDLFDKKVTYIKKPGIINQHDCYNTWLTQSNAQWILPIDDDEFLYISDKYDNNINVLLSSLNEKYNTTKYAFNWRLFYTQNNLLDGDSKKFYIDLFQYMFFCRNSLLIKPDGVLTDNHIKTIINTDYPHLYVNDNGNFKKEFTITLDLHNYLKYCIHMPLPMGTIHNPITKIKDKFYHALNTEYFYYCCDFFFDNGLINKKSDVYLAHFHYKTPEDNLKKIKNFKFKNILFKFQKETYNLDSIEKGINFVKEYLIYNNELALLLNKHKSDKKFMEIFK